MATQSDFLTANKNQVVATNGLNQTWLNYQRRQHGDSTSDCITGDATTPAPTLVVKGSGSLVTVSVVEAGSDAGMIYDAASTSNLDPAARLHAIPNTQGIVQASFRYSNGIVVLPGKGQAVTVTYSTD